MSLFLRTFRPISPPADAPGGEHPQAAGGFPSHLMDRINANDPRYPRGRKAGDEYQTELYRLKQYIGNRIIMDWIAPCLGPRVRAAMNHRLRENCE